MSGALTIAATNKSAAWGTAVVLGAADAFDMYSESFSQAPEFILDKSINGTISPRPKLLSGWKVEGEVEVPARYEGLEPLTAFVFGTAGVPTTVDTTGRIHALRPANSTNGIYSTLAFQKDRTNELCVHEFDSVKWTGFTLASATRDFARITYRGLGRAEAVNTAGGTNNNTTFASVTFPSNREIMQHRQVVVRMNDQTTGALSGTDAICVSSIEITLTRPLISVLDSCSGYFSPEPFATDQLEVSGVLGFAKYDNTASAGNAIAYAKKIAGTNQKMDITYTGDTLAGAATAFYKWLFQFPYVQLGEGGAPNVTGTGPIEWQLPFTASSAVTAPTGMSGITAAINLDITSKRTTDALA